MSLATLLNEPCTITAVTPATEDTAPTVGLSFDTVCYAEQTVASESTGNEDRQTQTWDVVLPAGTVVDGDATIHLPARGVTLEVQGPPHQVRNPRTRRVEMVRLVGTETR